MHGRIASIDYETYSGAGYVYDTESGKIKGTGPQGKGGIGVVGTPNYVAHGDFEVISLAYDLHDGTGVQLWTPQFPKPQNLLDHVAQGGMISAWNATFEWYVWNMHCVHVYGWPPLPLSQLTCTMARARRYSLPGSLKNASKVLGTSGKDAAGSRLIQKLTRPHTPTKSRPAVRWTPATAAKDFRAFYEYNLQDVIAEDEVGALIPQLTPDERESWLLDQTINARGVQVDVESLNAALDILQQATEKYTAELFMLTNGLVRSVGEVENLRRFCVDRGVDIPNVQKGTVAQALEREDLPEDVRRVLEIRQLLGAANVKKLYTLKQQVSSDGRLRDQYMYCGADRTGRASAGGVQLQNITSAGPPTTVCKSCGCIFNAEVCPCGEWVDTEGRPDWDVDAVEFALRDIATRDLTLVEQRWGAPIDVLCGCLRGLFTAREGHELVCCDFSAIEAVVLACLSRCQWRIDVFSTHGKIYEVSAANATGIPLQEILDYKKTTGQHHKARKTIGKVRELAGGYGGWINAWKQFGADKFMNDDEIKTDVLKWRSESPEIVDFWGGQYKWCGPGKWDYRPELFGLEGAAIKAIGNPGQWFTVYDIRYVVHRDILHCQLPSGRFLYYHRPKLVKVQDRLNRGDSYQITFEGYNSNAAKGPIGWTLQETYGGRLAENVTQAVAADIQFEALKRLERAGYPVVMHTHDEGTAEMPIGVGSVDEMSRIMSIRPEWAKWWPIKAAGWRHKRYQKD
jgi:DNA polymerase